MNELFEAYLPAWATQYVHLPYMFAVWLAVEWLRYQFEGIDNRIKPKHLTLVVGIAIGLLLHFGERFESVDVPVYKLCISYLVTTWFYEYGIKIVKEKLPFLKNIVTKQKQ